MPDQVRRGIGVPGAVASSALLALAAQLVSLLVLMTQAHAQSLVIPLQYYNVNVLSLGITVGINGGTPQPYLFDTGSNLFNAAYNPATWQGFGQTAPAATVPNGTDILYCYASPPCYKGNLVQAGSLGFYAAGATAGSTPSATLSASPGYQISAVNAETDESGRHVTNTFPAYFETHTRPPLYDTFFGIFGAGNFATTQNTPAVVGGVLGQAVIPGATHQGYVISANGQPNPVAINPPRGDQIVTIGGQSRQVSPCIACVTLGLTPQLIGQFATVSSGGQTGAQTGVVPWSHTGPQFPDPTSTTSTSGTGNNGSTEFGSKFTTTLSRDGSTLSDTAGSLLDTGTPGFLLSNRLKDGPTSAGTNIAMTGVTPSDGAIAGLPTTNSTLTSGDATISELYTVSFWDGGNVLGLPFLMQNSVMFDLTGKTIGYTPFYVTAANLATTANGPLIVGSSNLPLGLAGVISGPGGVTIDSGGAVQLSATNTYTGPTTIGAASGGAPAGQLLISGPGSIASSSGVANDGVFDISRAWSPVGIQSLSGSGQVNLGGQNLAITNGSGNFSGTMADGGAYPASGGSLTLSGGALTFSGTGTFTGGTSVTGGTLTLTGSLASGVAVQPGGGFVNQGTLANGLANSGSATNSGTITGGVVNLSQLTNVAGGIIHQGVANQTGGSVVNGGTIHGGFTNNSGGSASNSGTIHDGVTNLSGGSIANSGAIHGGLVNNAGGAITSSGTIALGVSNAGTLVTTAGTVFGDVANTGVFAHNGTVSGSVANAGTLSGSGTIAGNLANAGVVSPGNSIGTLSVGANYAQLAGSTYQVEVDGTGQSDLVSVGGAAALQGGTASVAVQPGTSQPGRTTYRILSAAGGVSGAFASTVDPYPFLLPSLSYDANNVYLTLQIGGFAAAAQTQTQYAVGRVLDANVDTASGDFAQVLSAMATNTLSPALAQATLTGISGQNYSTFSTTMVLGAQLFMNNLANQTGGSSPGGNRVALAEACNSACDASSPALWGAWGGALGGLGTIGAGIATGAVTYNVGGFAAGLDRLVAPGLRVGVTTGFTSGTQWTSGFSGNGSTDTFLAGLYGNYREGRVYADAVLGYAYSYNQMWRQIFIPGLQTRTAQGHTGANQFYGQVEGGYRFDIGPAGAAAAGAYVTPFARLQGYTGTQNAFTESGAQSLNLSVARQTTNSLRSVLGAQLGWAIDLGWREKMAMQLRLGWSHEYASTARPVTATLAGAPLMPFTTYGTAPTRDGAVLGFSANTAIADGASMYLRYEGNISGSDSAHALTAGLRMSW